MSVLLMTAIMAVSMVMDIEIMLFRHENYPETSDNVLKAIGNAEQSEPRPVKQFEI